MLFKYISAIQYWYRLLIITVIANLKMERRYTLESLGNAGANWWVPTDLINDKWLIYSGGVGEDISFDTELIKRFGCTIFAFDPTPRSIKYVKRHLVKRFNFVPIGLWKKDVVLKFYQPANSDHVSHSVVNLQKTSSYFKAACLTIKSVMKRLGHTHLDFLKLDIEGAAFAVLDQMLVDKIFPTVVAVEFDQPCTVYEMSRCIHQLLDHNYALVKQDHFNFVFIKSN